MKQPLNPYTKDLIINSFELETQQPRKEELEILLADRVEYLLTHRLEFFFTKMYTLDIDEAKIRDALSLSQNPPLTVAKLIIQRQLEKQITREKYR